MAIGIEAIFLLISGLVFLAGSLNAIPKIGKHLAKLGKFLAGFGVFIGIIDIILFIMALF